MRRGPPRASAIWPAAPADTPSTRTACPPRPLSLIHILHQRPAGHLRRGGGPQRIPVPAHPRAAAGGHGRGIIAYILAQADTKSRRGSSVLCNVNNSLIGESG